MPDMESLDRAVEEARNGWHRAEESPDFIVWRYYEDGECHGAVTLPKEVEAAVSAKARAEERERIYEEQRAQSKTWPIEGANVAAGAPGIPWHTFPPRSSEEAGNG